jgi:uracil phosphoribosyltransferase
MKVINFAEQNSVINHYMAELRDKNFQKHRMTFRHNVERIGEMMAYEVSKTLEYKPKTVKTPLGTIDIPLIKQEEMVVATVLRAGLPFHQGFLNVFDGADNAFVSAFRMYLNREHTEVGIHAEYIATPSVKGKTLLIVDPMLATGGSMAAAIEAILQAGKPKAIHVCCVIAAPEGIEVVKEALPDDATIWCAAIDEGMNEQKYIVPGIGDCGDLCYGEKLQSFRKIAEKNGK